MGGRPDAGDYPGYSPPPLLNRLIEDAQKIHKQRPSLRKCEEKAAPFTAGMNPTTPTRTTFDGLDGYFNQLVTVRTVTEAACPPT